MLFLLSMICMDGSITEREILPLRVDIGVQEYIEHDRRGYVL